MKFYFKNNIDKNKIYMKGERKEERRRATTGSPSSLYLYYLTTAPRTL